MPLAFTAGTRAPDAPPQAATHDESRPGVTLEHFQSQACTDNRMDTSTSQPAWQPLSALERRIVGVLVEKAKTTPEQYPLSLNALRNGCNQKNNRHPLVQVEESDLEPALDRLKHAGAVTEVVGGGRVGRFRHHLYEWLGVDKVELAVMAELLLRGAQTIGELRGRAARMEPIADVAALRPVVAALEARGLVVSLSNPGRGHVVTHGLYRPEEMEKVRRQAAVEFGSDLATAAATATATPPRGTPPRELPPREAVLSATTAASAEPGAPPTGAASSPLLAAEVQTLRQGLAELRRELADLRGELASLRTRLDSLTDTASETATTASDTAAALARLQQDLGTG